MKILRAAVLMGLGTYLINPVRWARLASLMIECGVGVTHYVIRLPRDYFETE